MIQVILGDKGSGKTKRLIDLANEALKSEHGVVVYVDDDKRYMYDLRHEIRFVNAGEFALDEHRSADWFYGLLGGMLAVNFDISSYVDSFGRLINNQLARTESSVRPAETGRAAQRHPGAVRHGDADKFA